MPKLSLSLTLSLASGSAPNQLGVSVVAVYRGIALKLANIHLLQNLESGIAAMNSDSD